MKGLFLTILIAATPAFAQWHVGSETHATGFFGAGVTAPINPLARTLDPGWNVSGGIGVTSRYVGVMLDAMYSDMGINHATLVRAGVPRGNQQYWAVTVDPILHVNERGPVDFYVTGGGGIYSQITEFKFHSGNDAFYSNTIYKPGVNGGAGFAFNLGYTPVKIFVEARFHHMFTHGSGASFIPVSVGVRF